jgi:uncharacterized membrane protein
MKKIILITLCALGAMLGCQRWTPERGVDHFAEKMKSELKLNPEQITKLDDLTASMKQMIKEDMAKRSAMTGEIKSMIESPKLDTAKVNSIMKTRQAQMSQHMDTLTPKLAAFHDSLDDNQRKKAAEKFEEFSKKWEEK